MLRHRSSIHAALNLKELAEADRYQAEEYAAEKPRELEEYLAKLEREKQHMLNGQVYCVHCHKQISDRPTRSLMELEDAQPPKAVRVFSRRVVLVYRLKFKCRYTAARTSDPTKGVVATASQPESVWET